MTLSLKKLSTTSQLQKVEGLLGKNHSAARHFVKHTQNKKRLVKKLTELTNLSKKLLLAKCLSVKWFLAKRPETLQQNAYLVKFNEMSA